MAERIYHKTERDYDDNLEPPMNDYNDDICIFCGRPPRYCKCDEIHDK